VKEMGQPGGWLVSIFFDVTGKTLMEIPKEEGL
jgi:hypothetical protein